MPTGDPFCQCGCGGWLGQCQGAARRSVVVALCGCGRAASKNAGMIPFCDACWRPWFGCYACQRDALCTAHAARPAVVTDAESVRSAAAECDRGEHEGAHDNEPTPTQPHDSCADIGGGDAFGPCEALFERLWLRANAAMFSARIDRARDVAKAIDRIDGIESAMRTIAARVFALGAVRVTVASIEGRVGTLREADAFAALLPWAAAAVVIASVGVIAGDAERGAKAWIGRVRHAANIARESVTNEVGSQ